MPETTGAAAASQWPDLPPELLREISGRLFAANALVRFHAVCRPWRDTLDNHRLRFPPWSRLPPSVLRHISSRLHAAADFARFHAVCRRWHKTLRRPPLFLPWLLAPSSAAAEDLADQRCRCVFSKTSCTAPGICVRDRRVACADGTAAWVVASHHETRLVNPLTTARLPISRGHLNHTWKWPDHTHRVVSEDGTVLVYSFTTYPPTAPPSAGVDHPCSRFRGAFLRPSDKEWTHVSKGLSSTGRCRAAAYYNGYTVFVDTANCHVLWPAVERLGDSLYYMMTTGGTQAALPDVPAGKVRRCSYLFESNGRLLLASILGDKACGGLSVSVHKLVLKVSENSEDERVVEWVRRDGDMSLLGDDVLFLGFPGSFAVEAEWFDGEVSGGTAYFIVDDDSGGHGCSPPETCSVYRYSFRDGATARLVETLPAGWHDARCMWFIPEPKIRRTRARRTWNQQEAPATCGGSTRRQELRIYAGDLSPTVDNSRLREMFGKHGKVASARVAYDRSGRSRGFGFVTMATQEGFDNAMFALSAVEEPQNAISRFGSVISPFGLFVTLLIILLIFVAFHTFISS